MTTTIATKFKSHLPVLQEAVRGIYDLRYNQKVYRKLYKYCKEMGAPFNGDSASDYEMIMSLLYEEGIE